MRSILFIVVTFFCLSALSQKSKAHRFVPYVRSLNVEKLAARLTTNLVSDSEKVCAIHSWMTYNIKFDIKKWMRFNYEPVANKKILYRRKTLYYSPLFQELCKYSNIQAVTIPGYVKDEYVDITDKFYLDESSWNAVYINNKWLLVDAGMDAGKIVYYKRTFAGYFIYLFSLGASDRLVYKPYFKQNPTTNYLCKTGYDFTIDHCPSDQIWQLITPRQTIEQFEQDSSYYFQKKDTFSSKKEGDNFENQRIGKLTMDDEEKLILQGFKSFEFNNKNNYGIANSYYLMSLNNFPILDPSSKINVQLAEKCDSISIWTKKAMEHCDSNSIHMLRQKNDLIATNKKKKEIITTQNKLLISSTDNVQKNLLAGIKIGISGELFIKANIQRNKIQLLKVTKSNKYSKSKTAKKVNQEDSLSQQMRINQLLDSLQKVNTEVKIRFSDLDNSHKVFIKNMKLHTEKSTSTTGIVKIICSRRLLFIDDLDLPVRSLKDELLSHKFDDDSLLIQSKNKSLIKNFYSEFEILKVNFKALSKFNLQLAAEYCKFKKVNTSNSVIDKKYAAQIENYKKEVEEYNFLLKTFKKKFKEISKISKQKLNVCNAENHSYSKEKFIEYQMNSTRSSYINRHYKARLSENKTMRKNALKLSNKAEKLKKKIS